MLKRYTYNLHFPCRLTFLFLLFLPNMILSQTTNLSGTINQYFEVVAIDTVQGSLTLASGGGSFALDDRVLIIQMKGAQIDETNSANFGTITNIGSAGSFEIATVCEINGNDLTFQYKFGSTYDTSIPNQSIQLVKYTHYVDVNVNGTLSAPAWDGAKGGVLVLSASGTVTLNADIDMRGMGFRGGEAVPMTSSCTFLTTSPNYFYNLGDQEAGIKGEGIAEFILNKEYGKGPQATGGGGGNDHNAGGAGGSNYSLGGNGGNNTGSSAFSCKGTNPGIGGKALSSFVMASEVAFLGGGGGAGNDNNGDAVDGGNGGGIVIIIADQLEGNGHIIDASGESAMDALGDGGSGGGAGGSVLIQANGYGSANFTIDVSGGDGGGAGIGNICTGPGGGGSGGLIRISTALPLTVNKILIGGVAGTVNAGVTGGCAGLTQNATNGQTGGIHSLTIPQGTITSPCVLGAHYPTTPLPIGEHQDGFIYSITPNPVATHDHISLQLNLPDPGQLHIRLINTAGQLVFEEKSLKEEGQQTLEIPTQGLAAGFFIFNIGYNGQYFTEKLLIKD